MSEIQSAAWATCVYGEHGVALDDPAEHFHEASRLHAGTSEGLAGLRLLERSPQLRATSLRAVKRHPAADSIPLPEAAPTDTTLDAAIAARTSSREAAGGPISLRELAGLLHAAYGVTHVHPETHQQLRAAPSGGALYPLELYPAVLRVDGLEPAVYHLDPLERRLERLSAELQSEELEALTPYPQLFGDAAVAVFLTAMIWRTRFKYGLRGYRFALLEAGHVCQNVLLAAAALDLAAVPVGGFYDRPLEKMLGANGVDEIALYAVSVSRGRS